MTQAKNIGRVDCVVRLDSLGACHVHYDLGSSEFLFLGDIESVALEALQAGASRAEILQAVDAQTQKMLSPALDHFLTEPSIEERYSASARTIEPPTNCLAHTRRLDLGTTIAHVHLDDASHHALHDFLNKHYTVATQGGETDARNYPTLVITHYAPEGFHFTAIQAGRATVQEHASTDQTITTCVKHLAELACAYAEHMAVLHGAALHNAKHRLLLCNESGSGKTTLAFALARRGYELIHDDILPIKLDGGITAAKVPMTVKSGAWSLLESMGWKLPDVTHNWNARLSKLLPPSTTSAVPVDLPTTVVFPTYRQGAQKKCIPLPTETAVKKLLASECVISHPSQENLRALVGWLGGHRYWQLDYGDTDTALDGIAEILS